MLHVCPACAKPFVVPTTVMAVLDDGYVMELSCNNCGDFRIGTFDDAAMEALDAELDRSLEQMARAAGVRTV